MRFLLHWATLALGLFVVTKITPITYSSPWDLVWAALVLIIFNAIIKPILIIITLPAVLLSLGLFVLIINALLLYWVPVFVHGFQVPSFGWAFLGSIILSLITWVFTGVERRTVQHRAVMRADKGDVIDI
ncbi:MAG TPA: phage holin family protein [Candidatus Methylacidiphilales bacterium]|jgi:putative membrane protein|nr:phage holin family protein [Candidatus Methylacidiphilales bacterium]